MRYSRRWLRALPLRLLNESIVIVSDRLVDKLVVQQHADCARRDQANSGPDEHEGPDWWDGCHARRGGGL